MVSFLSILSDGRSGEQMEGRVWLSGFGVVSILQSRKLSPSKILEATSCV